MARYAIVGVGHRSYLYLRALAGDHAADGQLVALCDINPGRLAVAAAFVAGLDPATYDAADFDRMVAETSPDRVIVTVPDRLHADYIVRAMELGCDVITEKPLTVDAVSCARILDTRARTGRELIVGFNYRYSPVRTWLKQVLMSGIIGHVQSATFEWRLDTHHGADYFRRWHRSGANSGGLFVHKATHHFDLLNWWLGDVPARVSASGRRVFYRPEMGDALGFTDRAGRCAYCPAFTRCGFRLDMAAKNHLRTLYADNEAHDLYLRDRCVFDADIDIEDSMQARIDYRGGIVVNYALTAFAPSEGYRVTFDGTRGRIEHSNVERGFVQPDGQLVSPPLPQVDRIVVQPHFQRGYDLVLPNAAGTHGGGDAVMLRRLFGPRANDEYGRAADARAGAWSALVGIAASASLTGRMPVDLADLVADVPLPDAVGAPFGPDAVWQTFDPALYPFLEGAGWV